MFNIEKYLEKFSKNINSFELDKTKILEIIEKYTQIKILKEDLEIKNYIVYIQASPGVKNKLFIFKEKILKEISEKIKSKISDLK